MFFPAAEFSPELTRVLRRASGIASEQGHSHIRTLDFILGCLTVPGTSQLPAAHVLRKLGVTVERLLPAIKPAENSEDSIVIEPASVLRQAVVDAMNAQQCSRPLAVEEVLKYILLNDAASATIALAELRVTHCQVVRALRYLKKVPA
jgi:hypothetical protein